MSCVAVPASSKPTVKWENQLSNTIAAKIATRMKMGNGRARKTCSIWPMMGINSGILCFGQGFRLFTRRPLSLAEPIGEQAFD